MREAWQFTLVERADTILNTVQEARTAIYLRHPTDSPRLLLLLDFNVPHMRDLTRLQKLASQVSALLLNLPEAGAWIIAPDFAKQRSTDARDEEIVKLFK